MKRPTDSGMVRLLLVNSSANTLSSDPIGKPRQHIGRTQAWSSSWFMHCQLPLEHLCKPLTKPRTHRWRFTEARDGMACLRDYVLL